jgi:membrane fusion protein, heavy metal efflux system
MKTLLTVLFFISFTTLANEPHQIKLSTQQFSNLGIKTGKLEAIDQVPLLYASAQVVIPPEQEYIVSTAQSGLVSKLTAAVGDTVVKDQVLAYMNSPNLLTLQQQFLKSNSESQLARLSYRRDQKLVEEGVIADRRWQETRSVYNSKVSEASEAKQLLEIAGMSAADIALLTKSRRLSSELKLRSPIDGVVLERLAVAGERMDVLQPIYRIANLDTLWLEINIPQERMGNIHVGDSINVEGYDVKTKLSLLGQSVNRINQSILGRAIVASGQKTLRAGQTVNVQIIQNHTQPAYKVPNVAIAQSEGHYFVFVRNNEGFAVTPISVIGKQGSDSFISGDLSGDEAIAINGTVVLKANWLGLGEEE